MSHAPMTVPVAQRRWYRVIEPFAATGALGAVLYFSGVSIGWLPGSVVKPSTFLGLAASICMLVSFMVRRRSNAYALAVMLLAVALLAWSVERVAHDQ